MKENSRIYVAGHKGLVGSAIVRNLQSKGYRHIIKKTHSELDLTNVAAVTEFFKQERPEYVFMAAAMVGGIMANNTYRADFIYENMMIQSNVIHHSYLSGVKKLLFLGSTCIYPKDAPQPMSEDALLTGPLEYTNEPYAIAKIAGIKMCESYNIQHGTNFISVMPTNLYGPHDNFDLQRSHVLPALLRKMHEAKIKGSLEVEIWGDGRPRRDFLYSDDMADACVFIMQRVEFQDLAKHKKEIRNTQINVGTGEDISIHALALLIKKILGYEGTLVFNTDKPNGTPVKLTNPAKLRNLGWRHSTTLEEGIRKAYQWYLENQAQSLSAEASS